MRRYKPRRKSPTLLDVAKIEYLLTISSGYFPGDRLKKDLVKAIIHS